MDERDSLREVLRRILAAYVRNAGADPSTLEVSDYDASLTEVEPHLDWVLKRNCPSRGESCVFSADRIKTAALFFDRVWCPPRFAEAAPPEIGFYGATPLEIWSVILGHFRQRGSIDVAPLAANSPVMAAVAKLVQPATYASVTRLFAEEVGTGLNVAVIPMYESLGASMEDYVAGDYRTMIVALEKLRVVDDEALTWGQVQELRKDERAVINLRRMRNWLDSEMIGKSTAFIADNIGTRVHEYEWSLKKHGVETVLGTLQSIVDPKFLTAAAALTAGVGVGAGHGWAEVAASASVLARVGASVTEKFLDLADAKRGKGAEVAFIADLKRLSSD